jgi:AbrB family looped-hinge helix DNA binding protein
MIYTLPMTKKGTITIPKKIRDDMKSYEKVVLIKKGNTYILRPVLDFMEIAENFKTDKVFTDQEIEQARIDSHLHRDAKRYGKQK